MLLKFSNPNSLKNPLFHLFLLIIGTCIGLVSALCLKTFISFTFPSFSNSPLPLLQTPPPPPPSPPRLPPAQPVVTNRDIRVTTTTTSLMHNMTDDELLERASRVSSEVASSTNVSDKFVPKMAFMFLTPGPLPLSPLWDMFFKGHQGMYSIYVHPHPSYNESLPTTSAFYGRRIPSQPVYWGTMSMIDAERRLLANALLDKHNQRFVLLSDSCIPLFNFTTVYNYLMGTNHSFLASFDDPRKIGRGRYNRRMWPTITVEQWRKGSQWFEIHRDLAVQIVSDRTYYQVFHEFCHPPCYNDEHYLPTLVNILSAEVNSNRSVTWVDWPRDGPHPRKFGWVDVNVELLHRIRFGSECRYSANVTNVCHLFARKFLPSTLRVLLKVAPVALGFGS